MLGNKKKFKLFSIKMFEKLFGNAFFFIDIKETIARIVLMMKLC